MKRIFIRLRRKPRSMAVDECVAGTATADVAYEIYESDNLSKLYWWGSIIFSLFLTWPCFGQEAVEVCLKDVCVQAEIADTLDKRGKGLMFRQPLAENQGMLFIFQEESSHGFWMKNVRFPLDIIWINRECNVVEIKPNLQPCQEVYEPFDGGHREKSCESYFPREKAFYVLEVKAGFTDKHKIKIGDTMSINGY